jgi:hypothetical protein
MTTRFRTRQAGEGKVGCFVSLTVLITLIAVGIKAGPIYYSNNELVSAINSDIGPGASRADTNMAPDQLADAIADQIRKKAKELEIPEAQKPGAVTVTVQQSSSDTPGNVHVVLRYERPVDFYGIYSYSFSTDQTMDCTIMRNIK